MGEMPFVIAILKLRMERDAKIGRRRFIRRLTSPGEKFDAAELATGSWLLVYRFSTTYVGRKTHKPLIPLNFKEGGLSPKKSGMLPAISDPKTKKMMGVNGTVPANKL